jgi:hypothetical protein
MALIHIVQGAVIIGLIGLIEGCHFGNFGQSVNVMRE